MTTQFGPEYAERSLELHVLAEELHTAGRVSAADRDRLLKVLSLIHI